MAELRNNKFYLEIKLKNGDTEHVWLPSCALDTELCEYTSGEAIDLYTTRFNNMAELLDDIRKNGYADLENISNTDISSISFRHRDNDTIGCYPEVAYRNSQDIINYLYGSLNYRLTFEENFKRYVIKRVISDDREYSKY